LPFALFGLLEATAKSAAKLLTKDEARRIAVNIPKLPDFIRPQADSGMAQNYSKVRESFKVLRAAGENLNNWLRSRLTTEKCDKHHKFLFSSVMGNLIARRLERC
jgi:hypothetical protein